ncbi:hypothetical protein L6R53_30535, partial [Myxococcota bacterium]|nr:hypothetical protein [Myxococcota bacterium]
MSVDRLRQLVLLNTALIGLNSLALGYLLLRAGREEPAEPAGAGADAASPAGAASPASAAARATPPPGAGGGAPGGTGLTENF